MGNNSEQESNEEKDIDIIWLCDCSSSMKGKGKIGSLNTIIREITEELKDIQKNHPEVTITVRAIRFSTGADWVHPERVSVNDFSWNDLSPGGKSDLGNALSKIAEDCRKQSDQNSPGKKEYKVYILITDGYPTDDWKDALEKLKICISDDNTYFCAVRIQDTSNEVLEEYVGTGADARLRCMELDNIGNIIQIVKFVAMS
jgi:uncharacterized protein YegL